MGARFLTHHAQFAYGSTSEEFVRLGVQFADGRKATNLRPPPAPPARPATRGPLLTPMEARQRGAWDTP